MIGVQRRIQEQGWSGRVDASSPGAEHAFREFVIDALLSETYTYRHWRNLGRTRSNAQASSIPTRSRWMVAQIEKLRRPECQPPWLHYTSTTSWQCLRTATRHAERHAAMASRVTTLFRRTAGRSSRFEYRSGRARRLPLDQIMFVANHAFIASAKAAGMRTAFVDRQTPVRNCRISRLDSQRFQGKHAQLYRTVTAAAR